VFDVVPAPPIAGRQATLACPAAHGPRSIASRYRVTIAAVSVQPVRQTPAAYCCPLLISPGLAPQRLRGADVSAVPEASKPLSQRFSLPLRWRERTGGEYFAGKHSDNIADTRNYARRHLLH
jgi:hypothetical protein